ncbi:MAG: sulfatase [Gemmatimonadota bacterium]|nr:sulfatase [Gemmatimonadota bacterium]
MDTTASEHRDFVWIVRYLAVAGVVAGLWWWGTRILGPWLIEQAYRGESLGVLNDVLAGRATTPLEAYLTDWSFFTRIGDGLLVLIALSGLVGGFFRVGARFSVAHQRMADREAGQREARLRPLETIGAAASIGLVTGALGGGYVATVGFGFGLIAARLRDISLDILWMSPLADAGIFVGAALILVVLGLAIPAVRARRLQLILLLALAVFGTLTLLERLYPYAAALLAIAIGLHAGRWLSAYWEDGVRRWLGRAGIAIAVLVPLLAAGMGLGGGVARQRALAALPPAPVGAPNILLLILDTVRSQNTSIGGYERPTTPALERLAGQSVVFDRAIAPAPWTLPSHAGMLTGRYNVELGTAFSRGLDRGVSTLPEYLRDQGYVTIASVANVLYATPLFGLGRGFWVFDAHPRSVGQVLRSSYLSMEVTKHIGTWFDDHRNPVLKRADRVNRDFLRRVDQAGGRPWFAMLNYFDAHEPYTPPDPYRTMFTDSDDPLDRLDHDRDYRPEEIEELIATYDGGIAFVDANIGRLMDELERRGVLDNTIVIVTSDHGESFLEHGHLGHAKSLYMSEIHVPLLVRYPPSVPAGLRIPGAVTLRDIPATVLDLSRLGDGGLPGTSLARYWDSGSGSEGSASPRFVAMSELFGRRALVTGGYHLLPDAVRRLYDLDTDPLQLRDVIDTEPTVGDSLATALRELVRTELGRAEGSGRVAESDRRP